MPTTHILETAGEVCPFPLNEAKAAIATIPSGDLLRIDFDCTQATEAIPRWAAEETASVQPQLRSLVCPQSRPPNT